MSKKYIYFKKISHLSGDLSCSHLSALEAASFINELDFIQNIFQLFQYEDLKLLISKSIPLQNLLTAHLPQERHHGYLWQGENLPDLLNLLQKTAGISTCIIFQRNSEPPPEILKSPFSRLLQQLEIYNWVIYIFPTYNQIRRYLESQSKNVHTEIDMDRYCRELWRHFENLQKNGKIYEIDKQLIASDPKRDWQALLMNIMSNRNDHLLFLPFAGDGSIIYEAILNGKKILSPADTCLRQKVLQEKAIVCHFDPAHYNKAISTLISQIRLLQTANSNIQKDLFAEDAEQLFTVFWEQEKMRYHEQKMKWLSIDLFKFLSIIRFLFEQQLVSREEQINNFIFSILVQWTDYVIKKKKVADPAANFLEFIRKHYLTYYMLSKIKELAPGYPTQPINIFSTKPDEIQTPIDAVLLEIDNKNQLLNEEKKLTKIFFPETNSQNIPGKKFPSSLDDDAMTELVTMINRQDNEYLLLGNYGRAVITRLIAGIQHKEAARCLMYWANIIDQVSNYCKLLVTGGKLAVILKPFFIQNLSGPEEIQIQKIIGEMLSNHNELHQYKIKHDLEIKYTDAFKRINRRIILLLENR